MKTSNLIKTSIFTGLMIAGAFMSLSFGAPVPYTLQTMFMLMAGIVLGVRYAPLSQVIYLLLGLFGLPVFTGGKGGMTALMSPTFGFLLGFVLGAWLTALLYEKLPVKSDLARGLVSTIVGAVVIYLPGILYFYFLQNVIVGKAMGLAKIAGFMVPFFVPDLGKAVAAAVIGVIARKALAKRELL